MCLKENTGGANLETMRAGIGQRYTAGSEMKKTSIMRTALVRERVSLRFKQESQIRQERMNT